jgi:hypothetical protein
VQDGQRLYEEVQRLDVEKVPIDAGGTEKHEPFSLNLDPGGAQLCLRLPRLGLYGMDFRLFDPRNLYPHADRMSFIFLHSTDLPSPAAAWRRSKITSSAKFIRVTRFALQTGMCVHRISTCATIWKTGPTFS